MDKLNNTLTLKGEILPEWAGKRLDQALALLFPDHSRSRLKEWITKGEAKVNGMIKRPRDKVLAGDKIEVQATLEAVLEWSAEAMPLKVIYEDESLLVINKPASLVVHPGAGNHAGTLVNALLHYLPSLSKIPRAGIVHRLDKDTTGLLVIAKTLEAQTHLVNQLQARTVKRLYEALVTGVLLSGGTLEASIGRHPQDRVKMAVLDSGKPAVTHYRILERFKHYTHLKVELETGRTHQIRVHMAYLHHPILGDRVYGRLSLPPHTDPELQTCLKRFPRQALHAKELSLLHPLSKKMLHWEAPLPEDLQALLAILRRFG